MQDNLNPLFRNFPNDTYDRALASLASYRPRAAACASPHPRHVFSLNFQFPSLASSGCHPAGDSQGSKVLLLFDKSLSSINTDSGQSTSDNNASSNDDG